MLLQNFEKIANLSLSKIGIGPVHGNILCVSECICSNGAITLLVQLNQVLQSNSGVDTPYRYSWNICRQSLLDTYNAVVELRAFPNDMTQF